MYHEWNYVINLKKLRMAKMKLRDLWPERVEKMIPWLVPQPMWAWAEREDTTQPRHASDRDVIVPTLSP